MKQISWIRAMGMVCVVVLVATGCGGGAGDSAATEDSFAALQEQKSALDGKRQEVAELQLQIDEALQAGEAEEEHILTPDHEARRARHLLLDVAHGAAEGSHAHLA